MRASSRASRWCEGGTAMVDRARPGPPDETTSDIEGLARLRDGTEVLVRRWALSDRALLAGFVANLADTSLSIRFFVPVPRRTALLALLEGLDSPDHSARLLLLGSGDDSRVIAHAEYSRDGPIAPGAEVAFLVADAYHGHLCATLLLHRLAQAARRVNTREFHAAVRLENDEMLEAFRESGYPLEEWWRSDAVQVTLPIRTPLPLRDNPAPRALPPTRPVERPLSLPPVGEGGASARLSDCFSLGETGIYAESRNRLQ